MYSVSGKLRLEELTKLSSDVHLHDPFIGKLVYVKDVKTPANTSIGMWATARLKSHDGSGTFKASMMYDPAVIVELEEHDLLFVNEESKSDVCKLEYGHEPAIIANIGQRFIQGNFFTAIGPGLIFVNPPGSKPSG